MWGGAAGCFPALIGWTAITGSLSWAPVVLFAVVFFWTPPHFWALAMRFKEDYAAAKVPMLPVVASERNVARQIVLYSWVMVATSLLLWPVAGTGWFYPASAGVLGAVFLVEAHRMLAWSRAGRTGVGAEADAAVPLVELLPRAAVRCGGDRPVPARLRRVTRWSR